MIKKYIKFELRSNWKLNSLFVCIPVVISLIFGIAFIILSLITNMKDCDGFISEYMVILSILFIFSQCGIIIYFFVRYYKTLYTEEHFFTHMLPLTSQQLFTGKWLSLCTWIILSFSSLIVSNIFILIVFATKDISSEFVFSDFGHCVILFLFLIIIFILYSCYISFYCLSIVNIAKLWNMHIVPGTILTYVIVGIIKKRLYFIFSGGSMLFLLFCPSVEKNGLLGITNLFLLAGIISFILTETIVFISFIFLNKFTFKKDALN